MEGTIPWDAPPVPGGRPLTDYVDHLRLFGIEPAVPQAPPTARQDAVARVDRGELAPALMKMPNPGSAIYIYRERERERQGSAPPTHMYPRGVPVPMHIP